MSAFRIPLPFGPQLGWQIRSPHEPDSFDLLPPEYSRRIIKELLDIQGGIPITQLGEPVEGEPIAEGEDDGDTGGVEVFEGNQLDSTMFAAESRVEDLRILEFAEEQPDIIGGLNSLYLRIRYPRAARESGIEGLVLVSFVVEQDGSTTDVRVLRSLHPLCDNAAVEAIQQTLFTPARQNGKRVRVRMHLPIRFVLIEDPTGLMADEGIDSPDA